MRIRITKMFTFEMAHALKNYDGPCRHLHGHSYTLHVTVSGEPVIDRSSPKLGMVMDFGDLKRLIAGLIIDKFDHALVLQKGYEEVMLNKEVIKDTKIILADFQPTSENLIAHFAELINIALPQHIRLEHLKLHETANSYAEWLRSDQ
ncbi:MAG: 6-carboxytetrahydropterin synthase [Bacteroidales bacterium]